jgi:hypothetical protein
MLQVREILLSGKGLRDASVKFGPGANVIAGESDTRVLVPSGDYGWHSRAVLSSRLSNTMDTDVCVAALEEVLNRYGVPKNFNTYQGRSSPVRNSLRPSKTPEYPSLWTARADGWTTSPSNACGAR